MASRALWTGQLRLSLVSIAVELHSATRTVGRVSFNQIHKPSGQRVRYEKTVPGVGPIRSEDIVKGYEVGDDRYILLDPAEVDAIRLESKKTLEIVQFVDACEIPPLYFDKPYYLIPTDELAEDAYKVIREALRAANKLGLGQLTMRGKEALVAIKPCGDGLLCETLHYADEIRDAAPMFADISDEAPDPELLEVATSLIDRKTKPFDAEAFHDSYADALHDLIEAKKKDQATPRVDGGRAPRPEGENVVDLMAALKESLKATATPRKKASTTPPKAPAKRPAKKKAS